MQTVSSPGWLVLYVAVLVAAGAGPARAHGTGLAIGPGEVWHHWSLDLWMILLLAFGIGLYGSGVLRLWRRAGWGRGVSPARVAAFLAGQIALIVALVSPLDPLGETLLTVHMIQHGILITVAPLLLLLGLPGAVMSWALPAYVRRRLARSSHLRHVGAGFSWMIRPLPAAALHGAVLWLWHMPMAFQAALASGALHVLEHVSFFTSALLFWYGLFVASRGRLTAGAAIAAAFITMMHSGFLGVLMTFAPAMLYEWYLGRTALWGLTPLEDQQLAGLVMWVPMGLVYLVAGLATSARFLAVTQEASSPDFTS